MTKTAKKIYALIPVSAMPWMKCFWERKKTIRIGMIIIVDAAMRGPHMVRRS